MLATDMTDWLRREFLPLTLATPDETLDQIIENSFRYFNTHSGVKHFEMVTVAGVRSVVSNHIKAVTQVYPATTQQLLLNDFPLWSLLGIQVIDGMTSDLILLSETYKNYQVYMGKDFHWTFVPYDDPDDSLQKGGDIYMENLPQSCGSVCVVGTRRIYPTEDLKHEFILDWMLRYSKAQLKMIEGNTLRKADIINAKNDGQELFNEGKEELEAAKKDLAINGRWVSFSKRI